MTNPIIQNLTLGQSTWYDNISRRLVTSGELRNLITQGITGITSNPTIFEKAISGADDYDVSIIDGVNKGISTQEIFEMIAIRDIQSAADALRAVYESTNGVDGYASLELPPTIAHDTEATVREGLRLFHALDRPNAMIKVPATPEGIHAFRQLTAHGVNVNVTLIFSLKAYAHVMEAYLDGLEDHQGSLATIASVASFFVSRVDTAVDPLIDARIELHDDSQSISTLLGTAAIANAQAAYGNFQQIFSSARFERLKKRGAHPQRPLWASTSTKNPSYPDTLYVDSLIGPDTVNTMPDVAVKAFMDHGVSKITIVGAGTTANQALERLADIGIDMDSVTDQLLREGVDAFAKSYNTVLQTIEDKATALATAPHATKVFLTSHQSSIADAQSEIEKASVINRIWEHDHTVWHKDPTEITDRLGWLHLPETIRSSMEMIVSLQQHIRASKARHLVLMGMGGTGLSPKIYTSVLPQVAGYPDLILLDSTLPETVQEVTNKIDPALTTFIAASKSGETIEIDAFYRHFRAIADATVGRQEAGTRFIAITDSGSPLEKLAHSEGFSTVLLNPTDVGGRFSALSLFGLVPAAIAGIDLRNVLDSAQQMQTLCKNPSVEQNPGAQLGTVLAAMCNVGINKLTLVTSPQIRPLGMWIEQMIAESLGKNGKGIVPIADEPILPIDAYGTDRIFAYIRLVSDDNTVLDDHVDRLLYSGFPVIRIDVHTPSDLGMEMYRWEFATAVAGNIIGIHPFNQENVQSAKAFTRAGLSDYANNGVLPHQEVATSIRELMRDASPPNYLSLHVYLPESDDLDNALAALREEITSRYKIATTVGYGPRYLHSTGELHKGGPPNGIYIQLVLSDGTDLPVPGRPYGFRLLAQAQAHGDFQALNKCGRRIVQLYVTGDPISSVNQLYQEVVELNGSS